MTQPSKSAQSSCKPSNDHKIDLIEAEVTVIARKTAHAERTETLLACAFYAIGSAATVSETRGRKRWNGSMSLMDPSQTRTQPGWRALKPTTSARNTTRTLMSFGIFNDRSDAFLFSKKPCDSFLRLWELPGCRITETTACTQQWIHNDSAAVLWVLSNTAHVQCKVEFSSHRFRVPNADRATTASRKISAMHTSSCGSH